jgi:hypothetical protein
MKIDISFLQKIESHKFAIRKMLSLNLVVQDF